MAGGFRRFWERNKKKKGAQGVDVGATGGSQAGIYLVVLVVLVR